ncbi:uncharacterized protein [Parasteatoda tepidariorum]|uniref:uncharacterized protein n=1 Tax=Parasteatoda tepidariorum TaxID=114398 RepID=UPI0039BC79F0
MTAGIVGLEVTGVHPVKLPQRKGYRDIGNQLILGVSPVRSIIKIMEEAGSTKNKPRSGRSVKEKDKVKRHVVKMVQQNPTQCARTSAKGFASVFGIPILEYGAPIYSCASETNLNRLERVQISAAKIITGLRRSCPDKIVLFESDLQPLYMRRNSSLKKYYNKLISFGDQNRTSYYLKNWKNNHRLKRNSPFSLAVSIHLVDLQYPCRIEPHSLRSCFSPVTDFSGIHFHTELLYPAHKSKDNPEFMRQMALETISQIPSDALQLYTDGSKSDEGHSGSGVFIKTPTYTLSLKFRNSEFCSVFRSELIAIENGLRHVENIAEPDFKHIWILTDSKSSIQHLSNWMNVGDRAAASILGMLFRLSADFGVHFQWIPSHVGIKGNEMADSLAKDASLEPLQPDLPSTFNEVFSECKKMFMDLWRVPPPHSWYFRKRPGSALLFEGPRSQQTCLSRFASGHLRCLSYVQGQKTFGLCTKCRTAQASPEHILNCIDFKIDEVFSKPHLFLDFLDIFGLMELV